MNLKERMKPNIQNLELINMNNPELRNMNGQHTISINGKASQPDSSDMLKKSTNETIEALQKKIERQNAKIAHLKDKLSKTRSKAMKERKSYEMALKKAADKLSAAEKKMHITWGLIILISIWGIVALLL